jgi:hypothetical protein
MTKVLIYGGKTGWIGGLMFNLCKEKGAYHLSLWYSTIARGVSQELLPSLMILLNACGM